MIPTEIVKKVEPSPLTPRQVTAEFRDLVAHGLKIHVAGDLQDQPTELLRLGYTPKYKIELFAATYYLTDVRFDENLRFLIGYVGLRQPGKPKLRTVYPRIFYKDSSLMWRVVTHHISNHEENWIGKGDLKWIQVNGEEILATAEETTNLPLEIQTPLDKVSRQTKTPRKDLKAIDRIARRAPAHRVEPYMDFLRPRQMAQANVGNLIHRGRRVAWFTRPNDPKSLKFVAGFEPNFATGLLERYPLRSKLYGGPITKYRYLSKNRKIQYQFLAAARYAWVNPPQALTTDLSTYGVRTIDVNTDDDLFVPAIEFHYMDEFQDPPELYSQIPPGFAGAISKVDPYRADASPWTSQLPVVREFLRSIRNQHRHHRYLA